MASNEALFSVSGYVATQPKDGNLPDGTPTLSFRVGWTPRALNRSTGEWADLASSFASVTCYRKVAEHARLCLRRGDAIVLKGTLRVREYADQSGIRRNSVDVNAEFLGHDMSRGTSQFNRQRRHTELTAAELAQSEAMNRIRLPGDVGEGWPDAADDADETGALSEAGEAVIQVGEIGEPGEVSEVGEPGEVGGPGEVSEPGEVGEPDEAGTPEQAVHAGRGRKAERAAAGV